MAEGKSSFILYSDSREMIEALTDEQAGKLLKHIFKYVNDENPMCEDPFVNLSFMPIKQYLKRDLKKWEGKQEQRRAAGRRSAEVRKQNATTVNDRSISSTVNGNVNGSVSGNVNEKEDIVNAPIVPIEESFYLTSKKKKLSGKRLETFKIFWDKFNYKTGKAEAAQAWLDIPTLNEAICCTIYKSAELEANKRPILREHGSTPKMASGWITARRWEDEGEEIQIKKTGNII